jgi:hypothetical protein
MPVPSTPMARPVAAMAPWCPIASILRARPLRIAKPRAAKITPKAFGHLRAVQRWPTRAYDAEAGEIQDLRIAAQIEQNRWIVDLQQGLGISRLGPVDQPAAGDIANRCQFFLGALKRIFLDNGLATSAGRLQASSSVSEAWNMRSGEPNLRSRRADNGMPGQGSAPARARRGMRLAPCESSVSACYLVVN